MRLLVLILPLWLFACTVLAQTDRVSEAEVQDESLFLDALQLRLLERWDEALESFHALEKMDPNNDVVLFELARIYWMKKDELNATAYGERAVNANPEKLVYREFLIDLYQESGNFMALNQQLEHFIKSEGYHEAYYYQLSRSYRDMGAFDDALDVLEKLEERTGYKAEIGKARLAIYQKEGNKKKIFREMDRMDKEFPGNVELLMYQAMILENLKEEGKLLDVYRSILKLDPAHVAANVQWVTRSMRNGNEKEFFSNLESLFKNPGFPLEEKVKLIVPLIPGLESEKMRTESMIHLVQILEQYHPGQAQVYALSGDVYFHAGQTRQAVNMYSQTLKKDKSVFLVWKNLMIGLDYLGEILTLKETSISAIDYFPNQAVSYYYAGKACLESGDLNEGMEWLREGIFMAGNNPRLKAEFHLGMAFGYLQTGDVERAQRYFDEVPSGILGAIHPFFEEIRGDLLLVKGDRAGALDAWQKALVNGGRKDRLRKKLEDNG